MFRNMLMLLILSTLLVPSILMAAPGGYPQKVEIITKSQANYKTPENTLSARRSALLACDLQWFDNTITQQDLLQEVAEFASAGLDRSRICDMEKNIREATIVEKIAYKDATILVVEAYSYGGSINKVPLQFVQEGGLWKFTNKYSSDDEVLARVDYVTPDENLVADLKLNPSKLNYNWFVATPKNLNKKGARGSVDKNTILCMVSCIKDPLGNSYSASQIDINSLLMNNVVKPQQWGEGNNQKLAVVVDNASKSKIKDKQALDTLNNSNGLAGNKSVLLVKFNQYQAMETFEDLATGKTYEVIVSGKLTTGKYFRAKSTVYIK